MVYRHDIATNKCGLPNYFNIENSTLKQIKSKVFNSFVKWLMTTIDTIKCRPSNSIYYRFYFLLQAIPLDILRTFFPLYSIIDLNLIIGSLTRVATFQSVPIRVPGLSGAARFHYNFQSPATGNGINMTKVDVHRLK